MKITRLQILTSMLFYLFSSISLAEDYSVFKNKIDINLEQKINDVVQRIKKSANITNKEEIKMYKVIKETDFRFRKDDKDFHDEVRKMGKKIIPMCEKWSKDLNVNIRKKTAIALGNRAIAKTVEYETMRGRIENEENDIEEEAITSIAKRMLCDKDAEVRESAVNILCNSSKGFKYNPATIEALKKVKREDESDIVRSVATLGLWQLGEKSAFTEEEWEKLGKSGFHID